ncbi:hypothetical protein FA95DRAFT_1561064 [Auriscalpium vulgare]|uniref:Uncharacterized protein n=1 Tax=Auriscalpium vulgare TaxID=40419 RepID=A0ACB8RP58_9AGAM|nr:hypothetical protein FA95DRAFT_1561064 [Auriscalpium vulgare]
MRDITILPERRLAVPRGGAWDDERAVEDDGGAGGFARVRERRKRLIAKVYVATWDVVFLQWSSTSSHSVLQAALRDDLKCAVPPDPSQLLRIVHSLAYP